MFARQHLVRKTEPLMQGGGSLLKVCYYGAGKVVDHCNIMGAVAACLASEDASGVTGTITHIDGGRHVRM